MSDTGHKSAMLAAIIETPTDMVARMAYADLLADGTIDEQGRSGFIQTQMAMADIAAEECEQCRIRRFGDAVVRYQHCSCSRRWKDLRHTERGWLDQWGRRWLFDVHSEMMTPYSNQNDRTRMFGVFRCGFIETIRTPWSTWFISGDRIRTKTPLRTVRLTTTPEYQWRSQGDSTVYRLRDGGVEHSYHDKGRSEESEIIRGLLNAEWPGVEFILPKTVTNA